MKTALCISGQPRNVEKGYEFISRNILDVNSPDVFIHTWKPQNIQSFINPVNQIKIGEDVDASVEDTIRKLYNPQKAIFEQQIVFDEKDYRERAYPATIPAWAISMWYSVKAANQLKIEYETEIGVEYDAVIRIRFDWAINEVVSPPLLDLNVIIMPNDCPHLGGINDQFAIGSSKNMNVYSTLYDKIEEYYRQDHLPFCNEILLGHHLRKNNIPFKLAPIRYGIVRGVNKIQWGSCR